MSIEYAVVPVLELAYSELGISAFIQTALSESILHVVGVNSVYHVK